MVVQWVKRPIAYSAGIRFSGEFTSVLAVKIWVEFDLSGSLCHSGGSYRPKAVILTSRELTFADADASSRSSPGQFSKRGDLESW